MITLMGVEIKPTVFPDKTTQVWKLPTAIFEQAAPITIDWRFEREDEIFIVAHLAALLEGPGLVLHVPYLPFARQDKRLSNDATFALQPFAKILNSLKIHSVRAVDVHNHEAARRLIDRFTNIEADEIHKDLIRRLKPDLIVFPDAGARTRYPNLWVRPYVVFNKRRNQETGWIEGYDLWKDVGTPEALVPDKHILVVDDLCDGGATFLHLAKELNANYKPATLDLFVTHGLFSKGRKPLEDAGYTLHTTNSLPRNPGGIPV